MMHYYSSNKIKMKPTTRIELETLILLIRKLRPRRLYKFIKLVNMSQPKHVKVEFLKNFWLSVPTALWNCYSKANLSACKLFQKCHYCSIFLKTPEASDLLNLTEK